ncbi:hypothetical protein OTERR_04580 [Oryzomicrobium terrae]|uniref:DUF2933 domain-containing protein n=1 Tax=Oryzomicrobium terrae TaxID=1735038 RepID=A0A5C1E5E6_9RHOO|nr:DUF2933 domain-containing protein [Oryzomicrobium terrae]QEL63934.1 hypothetical protein OTERR_04580 [Oryzomicrobium terrae]
MSGEHESQPNGDQKHDHRGVVWVWWVFAAIAAFYLFTEHHAHLFGILPYLLFLACPLMHFFMHRHHGHHPQDSQSSKRDDHEH